MEKEESSGEKLEGLSKQEVSGIHSVKCTSDAAQPALWCRLGSISSAARQQGASMAGLPCLCPILCALLLLPGAQHLLCFSVLPVDVGSIFFVRS